jgi:pimeloyl-ACP methyl ester carboxylesterase
MLSVRKLIAALAALAVLYFLVSYRMAVDLTTAERIDLEGTPADYGRAYEQVRFRSRRGDVTLDGWYLVGRGGMPVVIFVHGISSNRTGEGMTELACMLNARGYGALLFDLRGHGVSGEGTMSGGWHERMDVLGAFDYLRGRGVSTDSIGLLGMSVGAATAALAAAAEPRIRAAVLDCPFARVSELIENETGLRTPIPKWLARLFKPAAIFLARRLYDIEVNAIAPEEDVARLDYPVLVIAAPDDDRIPASHGVRVHAAASEGSDLWMVHGVEHCGAFTAHPERYADRVCEYFESRLG